MYLLYTAIIVLCLKIITVYGLNNAVLPFNHRFWGKVELVYYHDFPYYKIPHNAYAKGCTITHRTKSYRPVMHCVEHISLLRPEFLIGKWKLLEKRQGYIPIALPEFGISNVQAHITGVKYIAAGAIPVSHSQPVTGIFIRHTSGVRTYAFQNLSTGKLTWINATPEHRFYVVNQHRFVVVSMLSSDDTLVNAALKPIKPVCLKGRFNHCGKPYRINRLLQVYNLEVYRHHTYFIGDESVKVHNVYVCYTCKNVFIHRDEVLSEKI